MAASAPLQAVGPNLRLRLQRSPLLLLLLPLLLTLASLFASSAAAASLDGLSLYCPTYRLGAGTLVLVASGMLHVPSAGGTAALKTHSTGAATSLGGRQPTWAVPPLGEHPASRLGDPACLSTPALKAALEAAAMQQQMPPQEGGEQQVGGAAGSAEGDRSGRGSGNSGGTATAGSSSDGGGEGGLGSVVLTNCDLRCFEALFDPFMAAIGNASGGTGGTRGFTQHVVVVAIGESAFKFCQHRQQRWHHGCVLDPYCFMERNGSSVAGMVFNRCVGGQGTDERKSQH